MRYVTLALAVSLLCGCSSDIRRDDRTAPISLYRDTRHVMVVNFQPDATVAANPRWGALKASWREALRDDLLVLARRYDRNGGTGPIAITADYLETVIVRK